MKELVRFLFENLYFDFQGDITVEKATAKSGTGSISLTLDLPRDPPISPHSQPLSPPGGKGGSLAPETESLHDLPRHRSDGRPWLRLPGRLGSGRQSAPDRVSLPLCFRAASERASVPGLPCAR